MSAQTQDAPNVGAEARPVVRMGPRVDLSLDQAEQALVKLPDLYVRGGKYVKIDDGGRICELSDAALVPLLSAAADFVRPTKDGEAPVAPSRSFACSVRDSPKPKEARHLDGIVFSPLLRPDGNLVQAPGYDPASRFVYLPRRPFPPIPDWPTRDSARAAALRLLEPVHDFPFASDADRSAWLALVLTLLGRPAFRGPAPLFVIDATTRGSGKGKLAQVAAIIGTGAQVAETPWNREARERAKEINGIVIDGVPVALFDNVTGELGDATLDAVLTSGDSYRARKLGSSDMRAVPARTIWLATVNGASFGADTARRALRIRLEPKEARPEKRTGFRIPGDLLRWVEARREDLAAHGLTILRAYKVARSAGQDAPEIDAWGSFEAWSDLVRAALVWAGCGDPIEARDEIDDDDQDVLGFEEAIRVLHAWFGSADFKARKVRRLMAEGYAPPGWALDDAREAIDAIGAWDHRAGKVDTSALGRWLSSHRGRRHANGARLERTGRAKGAAKYRVAAWSE